MQPRAHSLYALLGVSLILLAITNASTISKKEGIDGSLDSAVTLNNEESHKQPVVNYTRLACGARFSTNFRKQDPERVLRLVCRWRGPFLYAHPNNTQNYYKCANGILYLMTCDTNTVFSSDNDGCIHAG